MSKQSRVDEDFTTPREELTPVSIHTSPPPTKAQMKADDNTIPGIDLKSLHDDEGEGDDPFEGINDEGKNPEQFVFAKFINAPLMPDRNLTVQINGINCTFPRGKWVLAQRKFVTHARTTGVLDFVQNPAGDRMQPTPNHPTIQVQELPDQYRDPARITEFKKLCDKTRKTETLIAHSAW